MIETYLILDFIINFVHVMRMGGKKIQLWKPKLCKESEGRVEGS